MSRVQDRQTMWAVLLGVLTCGAISTLMGCSLHLRAMTDAQVKAETLGRLKWNGSDVSNTLKGAKALEQWRQENDSPLAGTDPFLE